MLSQMLMQNALFFTFFGHIWQPKVGEPISLKRRKDAMLSVFSEFHLSVIKRTGRDSNPRPLP